MLDLWTGQKENGFHRNVTDIMIPALFQSLFQGLEECLRLALQRR